MGKGRYKETTNKQQTKVGGGKTLRAPTHASYGGAEDSTPGHTR